MTAAEMVEVPLGEAVVFSRGKIREVEGNEDCAAVVAVDDRAVLIVADGAGGYAGAAEAAKLAIDHVADAVAASSPNHTRAAILDGIEAANRAVLEMSLGAATTLVIAEVADETVRTYHAGDSQFVWCGPRGRLKYQTMPHSPVGYAVAAGLIDPDDALLHADLSIVSNVLGCEDMRVEVGSALPLPNRDTLVLGSDGLFDNLHMEEIVDVVRVGDLEAAANTLADLTMARMANSVEGVPSKPDDLTFIMYRG